MHNAAKILCNAQILVLEGSRMPPSDLSRTPGGERHLLQKLIRTELGSCHRHWKRRLIVEAIAKRIGTSDDAIKEIAGEYGYRHPQNLTRAFRRQFGCHPSLFRGARTGK